MTYQETLDYLYAQLPMFQRIGPAAYKVDIDNTVALCAHMGNPHLRFPSIHIGGTNGKGSVSHILASVCQAAGLKTGLYISPHYKDFRERIKINGQYIPRNRVIQFVAEHRDIIESIQPSFFEVCVALAFDYFARERVDIAVVEVGLGGRLDSTNIITPLLSVITNISYDHTNLLGDTLPKIAFEKAGIIKPGIPVVIGESDPVTDPVFTGKATEVGAPIVFADRHYQTKANSPSILEQPVVYQVKRDGKTIFDDLIVDAGGPYQAKNLATALQAIEILDHSTAFKNLVGNTPLFPKAVRLGLEQIQERTRFQGRWQIIGRRPTVLCDSAHNEAGIRIAFEQITQSIAPGQGRLHVVTGFVNDKDVAKVLPYYPKDARYYFAKADIPRGMPASELKAQAASFGLQGRAYTSVRNALKAARRAAAPDDLIVVIGSIFVTAEVI
jgi:dihydrofolate synthase/folylpolyglutamate synthase